jgi:plasmid stabilization system protein ParE
MAKEIRWSLRANKDRFEIEDYWTNRNKSNAYSLKLDQIFRASVNRLADIPDLGIKTKYPNTRFIIVGDYLIYYRNLPEYIEIVTIWDSRRDPKKLKL